MISQYYSNYYNSLFKNKLESSNYMNVVEEKRYYSQTINYKQSIYYHQKKWRKFQKWKIRDNIAE